MAKTPLFSLLTRALRLGRRARRTGQPLAEVVGADREARAARRVDLGRRRALMSGTGAALALPFAQLLGTSGCSASDASVPVAIVGGGMAGLHAAYRLRQRGLLASVFEASPRLGGRMYTDRTTFAAPDGQHCELGGELIDTGHLTMHDLSVELGLELLDYSTDDASLVADLAYLGGRKVPEDELLLGFAPIAAAIDAALGKATNPDVTPSYTDDNGLADLDELSIAGWLDSIGAASTARTLLELAYNIEFGLETSEQSALNLITLVSTDTTKIALFGDSDERFHTAVGNDAFTTRLAAALDPQQVALEHALVRVTLEKSGRHRLAFSAPGGTREITADRVVLTLPFTRLREVELVGLGLSPVKERAIKELGYGTNSKLMVGFSSRPWRALGSNGGTYSDLGYQSTWETSRLQPGPSGLLTNYTGGQHGLDVAASTPDKQRDAFLKQLDVVFPGASAASSGQVARMGWPAHPYTKASYSAYRVGQWTSISGVEVERAGNVLFAGEHTSVDAQGYMEGAALTGAMAAEAIATDLALPAASSLSLPARRIGHRARLTLAEGSWLSAMVRGRRATSRAHGR